VTFKGSRAFTLLEALIAMGIFALIGMLAYGTFARSVEARDRAEAITSRYHQVRQAMLRMSTEISMAFITAHKDCDESRTETRFVGKRSSGGMRLDFTSFSHTKLRADANESDQNELSYYIDRHPDDAQRSVLMRREQVRIDDEPDEGGEAQIMAEDVTDLEFEFYDDKDDEWVDEWDSDNLDTKYRLPMFVSIAMKALNPAGEEEKFVSKTRIFVRRQILITGTGFSRCID
jgi:general secretion pathway protein J